MTEDLDTLLRTMRDQPLDRPLDGLDGRVRTRLNEISTMSAQTWHMRAAATAFVTLFSIFISATAAPSGTPASASSAWSRLAPSSLLEDVR